MKSIDEYISLTIDGKLLNQYEIKWIMQRMIEILRKEPNVKRISGGVTLVGDIHGQFNDLKEMFRVGGEIPDTNYLFLGDYVDRGPQSVEVIIYLSLLKLKYPNSIHLLRGNHESKHTPTNYGFYIECLKKYNTPYIWQYIIEMFDFLPLAAVISDKIFCIHGGLSPLIQHVSQIDSLDRFNDIPTEGPIADLMWSDPDANISDFKLSERGAGYFFGERIVDKFLHLNSLDNIVRAHQLCMEGFNVSK
jgi:serine/threonine-protein phosphatase PPG1